MTEFDRLKTALDTFTPEADSSTALRSIQLAKEKFEETQGSVVQTRQTLKQPSWIKGLTMTTEILKRTFLTPWGLIGSSGVLAAGLAIAIFPTLSFNPTNGPFVSENSTLVETDDIALVENKNTLPLPSIPSLGEDKTFSERVDTGAEVLGQFASKQVENLNEISENTISLAQRGIEATILPKKFETGAANAVSGVVGITPKTSIFHPLRKFSDYFDKETSKNQFVEYKNNGFHITSETPISTFSVDVDTASYSYVRSNLTSGKLPDRNSIRIEELVNYFDYDYPAPTDGHPFAIHAAVTKNPWNTDTRLAHIALQGVELNLLDRNPLDLVFLIDTSGSMNAPDKLPLLKQSFKLLLNNLRDEDTVSIVTYAGSTKVILEPTSANNRADILRALEVLDAGGSTSGSSGIKLAYSQANKVREEGRIGRIILATDGDFNIGITDPENLKRMIVDQRENGTFLSILGFGTTGVDDAIMQSLAQNGNGVAYHIDTFGEAKKVLSEEITSTLFTIAEDVKIQIEFNPNQVAEYRLIGYETRTLDRSDFNNDKVDAGEVGAGHSVTAIYEITPVGSNDLNIDPLRYVPPQKVRELVTAEEIGYIKLRYKLPEESESVLISKPLKNQIVDFDLNTGFATAVAWFGKLLRDENSDQNPSFSEVEAMARKYVGVDKLGFRLEGIKLMNYASSLQ